MGASHCDVGGAAGAKRCRRAAASAPTPARHTCPAACAGSKSLGPVGKRVRSASATLDREQAKIVGALAADKKADGLAAIEDLKQVGAGCWECRRV